MTVGPTPAQRRLLAADILIGEYYGRAGDRCPGYRAAYLGDDVLTGPEHAGLSDADLVAVATAEAIRAGIMEDYYGTRS